MRRAKIVCTIGPASREEPVLEQMARAGMDVARLNMSHGTQAEHAEVIARLRRVSATVGRPLAILLDLSGPKIRLGELDAEVDLAVGDEVVLTAADEVGRGNRLPVRYDDLADDLLPGHHVSMADGSVLLEATERRGDDVLARVLSAGRVSSRKGIALPGGADKLPALTDKDVADLRFGLAEGVDWVAMSFVRSPDDALGARQIMEELGCHCPLLAKIEKSQVLDRLDEVVEAFDGVMVARGDLGVEVPLERVPEIQKGIIRRANAMAKPVVTATQMLLSMVDHPRPTRAEVTDVANAILDGSDAVMLSEETAVGEHPVQTVATMAAIAERAPAMRDEYPPVEDHPGATSVPESIAAATWHVARQVGAKAIVVATESGSTARLVAATRPQAPILALSHRPATVARLCLTWGVSPRPIGHLESADALFEACRQQALDSGIALAGERIVVSAGLPIEVAGTTNVLRVMRV